MTSGNEPPAQGEMTCQAFHARLPPEAAATDPEVLRSGLIREAGEHRRAECLAHMQAEVVQLALDLLVRQPDIEGFFGALTKALVHADDALFAERLATWSLASSRTVA